MSEELIPDVAAKATASGILMFVHARTPTCSLLLEAPPVDAAGTAPPPRVVRW